MPTPQNEVLPARWSLQRGSLHPGSACPSQARHANSRDEGTSARGRECPLVTAVYDHDNLLARFAGSFSKPSDEGSNRRPPPYHRARTREPRASAGSRGHKVPARRGNRPNASSREWTVVPGFVFPQRSLVIVPSLATRRSDLHVSEMHGSSVVRDDTVEAHALGPSAPTEMSRNLPAQRTLEANAAAD